tara:strand:+ start:24865 stop:25686 length:822 start_codon:yes stop_codon:yes gene_type:complete
MKNLILILTIFTNVFIIKSQCDYTNSIPSIVGSSENVCFTEDVTLTSSPIQNQGTITINDGVTVTFTGASFTNYWASVGKFKLMGCDAKIVFSGSFSGSFGNVDIERYCNDCSNVNNLTLSSVDLGYFKTTGASSFVDIECQVVLPVELISYVCNKKEILWSTASEINSDYFTILYSDNGIDFTSVTNINAKGNSFEIVNYSYPINKKGYYKLTQTDYDGTTEEFSIKFCGPDVSEVTLLATYDILGQIIQDSYRGIIIEVYSDGTTKRIYRR